MEKVRTNSKVGRPIKQDRERTTFSLYFLGKEQCDLFDQATLKATQEHIGLKYVILDALDDYINGRHSVSKGKYSGAYYKDKKEKVRLDKAKKLPRHISAIEKQSWYGEWAEGLKKYDEEGKDE